MQRQVIHDILVTIVVANASVDHDVETATTRQPQPSFLTLLNLELRRILRNAVFVCLYVHILHGNYTDPSVFSPSLDALITMLVEA